MSINIKETTECQDYICNRPNIAYAVGVLGRFSSNSGPSHWKAAKHLCRYLQGTKDYRLTYASNLESPGMFTTFCDTDYEGDKDSRRSTSGIVVR